MPAPPLAQDLRGLLPRPGGAALVDRQGRAERRLRDLAQLLEWRVSEARPPAVAAAGAAARATSASRGAARAGPWEDPEMSDEDRDAIVRRRAALVAAAMLGLVVTPESAEAAGGGGAGGDGPGGGGGQGGQTADAQPQPCLCTCRLQEDEAPATEPALALAVAATFALGARSRARARSRVPGPAADAGPGRDSAGCPPGPSRAPRSGRLR